MWKQKLNKSNKTKRSVKTMSSRKETYEELIKLGYSPQETWALIAEMNFAEDEEE